MNSNNSICNNSMKGNNSMIRILVKPDLGKKPAIFNIMNEDI